MRKHTLFGLLLCLLTACGAPERADVTHAPNTAPNPSALAAPAATPTPIALQLQGGNLVRLDLPPDARPTEAAPTMTVSGLITDASTGKQVKGTVYLGENVVASDVNQFALVLPGELEEWLIVKAEGYHEWKVRMRYRVLHHKTMQTPVQLVPLTEPAPPASQI